MGARCAKQHIPVVNDAGLKERACGRTTRTMRGLAPRIADLADDAC